MRSKSILVVDDDPKMRRLLRRCLEGEGFAVAEADRQADVLARLSENQTDLVTLDIGLGHESGLTIARDIRKVSDVPIIMVTARDDVIDRVVGLEIGADDYITKPFHVREVIARVHALLRRSGALSGSGCTAPADRTPPDLIYTVDDLRFDPGSLELQDRKGCTTDLTTAEVKLLQVFLDRPRRALSRDQIMMLTTGGTWSPLDRSIDNQIARLRRKVEHDPAQPHLIKTVRGIGYMLTANVSKTPA